jgi:hypothetical protein
METPDSNQHCLNPYYKLHIINVLQCRVTYDNIKPRLVFTTTMFCISILMFYVQMMLKGDEYIGSCIPQQNIQDWL